MPVTTSTGVIAPDRSIVPALEALLLDILIMSLVPKGILSLIEATIFMLSRLVVRLYLVFASLTLERSEPATASVIVRGFGFPVTEIFVIGFTSMVTDWVALLPSDWARAFPEAITNKSMEVAVLTIGKRERM